MRTTASTSTSPQPRCSGSSGALSQSARHCGGRRDRAAPCSARWWGAANSPFIVLRDNLEYRYTLPPAWAKTTQTAARGQDAFRALVAEMGRLLADLTGSVVINRLEQVPELRARGLVWRTPARAEEAK